MKILLFKQEQKVFDINGIRVGGQIGENPVLLIGSIFYRTSSKKVLKDSKTGEIDKHIAENLIHQQVSISEKTGVPHAFDVGSGSETPQALVRLIEFVANQSKAPILLDGLTPEIRIPSIMQLNAIGLSNQLIYNSINPQTTEEELVAIKNSRISAAILLTFHSSKVWPQDKMSLLIGTQIEEGLLTKAKKANINKTLIDTATLDIPSVAISGRTIHLIKKNLGLPAGCGTHNALHGWKKLQVYENIDKSIKKIKNVSIHAIPLVSGADFLLYGPISYCNYLFPMIAMNEAILTYNARHLNKYKNINRSGPLFKIFKS